MDVTEGARVASLTSVVRVRGELLLEVEVGT